MHTRRSRAAYVKAPVPDGAVAAASWLALALTLIVATAVIGWASGGIPTSMMVGLAAGLVLGFVGTLFHVRRKRTKARRLEKELLRRQWRGLMMQYGAGTQENRSERAD